MVVELNYLTSTLLLQKLKCNPDDLVVIDVRELDFDGGHIDNCLHIDYSTFDDHLDYLVQKFKQRDIDIVFHCMFSKVRGNECAMKFVAALKNQQNVICKVFLLIGGFSQFVQEIKANPQYINFIRDCDLELWNIK